MCLSGTTTTLAPASSATKMSNGDHIDGSDDDEEEEQGLRGRADNDESPASSALSDLALPRETKLFVLCVHRMQRRRRERSASLSRIQGISNGGSGGGAGGGGAEEGCEDPLITEPFEVWSTSHTAAPPGAPRTEVLLHVPLPPNKKKNAKGGKGKKH